MRDSWQEVTIKDIAVVDWGNTSLTKKAFVTNGPYLGVSAAGCDGRMDHAEHKRHTPVLSAIGAQCGRMFMPEEDFTAIKNTITLTPIGEACDPFFLYYLMTYVELPQRGAGQPFISKGDIQKFKVPLPPLEEQQRIVAVLDEAFEGLARARAHAEANLLNARELFAQGLARVFSEGKSGWRTGSIEELCRIRSGTTVPKALEQSNGDVPYVKVGDMNLADNESGIVTSSRYLRSSDVSVKQIIPAGATIFPKRGGAIMTNKKRKVLVDICADLNVMAVMPGQEIDEDFLHFFFLSVDMRKIGSGAAIPQINNYDINPLRLSFPSDLGEQAAVAERLQRLKDQSAGLSKAYETKLEDLDDLHQSLLQKAFAGELT